MMHDKLTFSLFELGEFFHSDEEARIWLEEQRWPTASVSARTAVRWNISMPRTATASPATMNAVLARRYIP